MPVERDLEIIRVLEPIDYTEALRAQIARRIAIEESLLGNALFLLEHTPVITLGRNAHVEHILKDASELAEMGIALQKASRGGDVTYHGPGQLVAYPVLDLRQWRKSIRWYLRSLEDVVIGVLASYGIQGRRVEGLTGVWVEGAKVAAIGIGVHNWVTYHGVSLNLAPDMAHLATIVPCGIADKPVTSLKELLRHPPAMDDVASRFEQAFRKVFLSAPTCS